MIQTFIYLGNSIVIYELEYTNVKGEYDVDLDYQLWISLFMNVSLLVSLNI